MIHSRTLIAFLVAPLIIPLSMLLFMLRVFYEHGAYMELSDIVAPVAIDAGIGYAGTLIFGVPIYLILIALKKRSFLYAPIMGALSGALTFYLPWALFTSVLHEEASMRSPVFLWNGILNAGILGALVGIAFWFIARPDKIASGASGTA